MTGVRSFIQQDIPSVAELFLKVFRRSRGQAPTSLMEYIDHIYFHNPWYTEDIPSVVYQTKNGRVTGFLGVLPFQMVYKGRSVTAAIGGNYMVDPDAHDPFAGVLLLKKLFTGPQDLTMSDTGNDIGRRRWEEMGATTSDLHSLHWIRVLRPARFLVALGVNPKLKTLETLIRPLCTAADAVVTRLPHSPLKVRLSTNGTGELGEKEMFNALPKFLDGVSLRPHYTFSSLSWLLGEAEKKEQYGKLHKVIVRDEKNDVAGWFLYYPNPGKTGQVLQVVGKRETMGIVLDQLFAHAWNEGSLALTGRFVPGFMKEFSRRLCLFYHRSNYFLIYSKNLELLNAVHHGDAFLTRLEGEWWTRFQGDTFN